MYVNFIFEYPPGVAHVYEIYVISWFITFQLFQDSGHQQGKKAVLIFKSVKWEGELKDMNIKKTKLYFH